MDDARDGAVVHTGTGGQHTIDSEDEPNMIDARRFVTRHVQLPGRIDIAYVREGAGHPVVLLHGYPMTKRLWWRNIAALSAAGLDVIAPDLRGYGESGMAPDGRYDVAAYADDIRALLAHLVDRPCTVVGGDIGAAVALDLALRHPDAVTGICLFNGAAPEPPPDRLAELGLPEPTPARELPALDYFVRQGEDPDGLLAELDTPEARREYVAGFYTHRGWARLGAFDLDEVAFMCEPFGDADRLRTAWVDYEIQCGRLDAVESPRAAGPVPQPALVLFGPADPVGDPRFVGLCRAGFVRCLGPFVIPDAGHFLPWEQPEAFNEGLVAFTRWMAPA
jgi:pimeloyl-ACP methyl ester carboxylesterase